jgi:hypothetical protein
MASLRSLSLEFRAALMASKASEAGNLSMRREFVSVCFAVFLFAS